MGYLYKTSMNNFINVSYRDGKRASMEILVVKKLKKLRKKNVNYNDLFNKCLYRATAPCFEVKRRHKGKTVKIALPGNHSLIRDQLRLQKLGLRVISNEVCGLKKGERSLLLLKAIFKTAQGRGPLPRRYKRLSLYARRSGMLRKFL